MRFYLQRKNKVSIQRAVAFSYEDCDFVILFVVGPDLFNSWVRLHNHEILNDTWKYKEIKDFQAFQYVSKHNCVELIFTSGLEP